MITQQVIPIAIVLHNAALQKACCQFEVYQYFNSNFGLFGLNLKLQLRDPLTINNTRWASEAPLQALTIHPATHPTSFLNPTLSIHVGQNQFSCFSAIGHKVNTLLKQNVCHTDTM